MVPVARVAGVVCTGGGARGGARGHHARASRGHHARAARGHHPRAAAHAGPPAGRAGLALLDTEPREQQPERAAAPHHHQVSVHHAARLPERSSPRWICLCSGKSRSEWVSVLGLNGT